MRAEAIVADRCAYCTCARTYSILQAMSGMLLLLLFSFVVNLPFGYLRSRSKRYSLKWFTYIHVPVVLIIIARLASHTDYRFIPLFLVAAIAGQYFGGRIGCS